MLSRCCVCDLPSADRVSDRCSECVLNERYYSSAEAKLGHNDDFYGINDLHMKIIKEALQRTYTKKSLSEDNFPENRPSILVIDNNRDMANILCSLLNYLGYKSFAAYEWEYALNNAISIKPDLVLCDLLLPDRGAYKIAKSIRNDFDLNYIYSVGLTYNGNEYFKLIAMELGFDSFFNKQIQSSILREIVNKLESKKSDVFIINGKPFYIDLPPATKPEMMGRALRRRTAKPCAQ